MSDERQSLAVLTLNAGNGLAAPERLVRLLRSERADLVGLQELARGQAVALERGLAAIYPYRAVYPGGFAGKAVLSRFPLVQQEQLDLYPDRPDLKVAVDLGRVTLTFLVAHPPPPRIGRRGLSFDPRVLAQLRTIARLAGEGAPAIVAGDFNLTAWHAGYALMQAAGLRDAFRAAGRGRGATLPLRLGYSRRMRRPLPWLRLAPVARVDYIWHTSELTAEAAWTGPDAGSDHLPVVARLVLPPER